MRTPQLLIILALSTLLFAQCGMGKFKDQTDKQFGDQHFKTAIALIELYKVRFGEYPESLDSLKFAGDWDQIALASVKYQKLNTGYELDLERGWMGKPDSLGYPEEFWKGLGLVRSNMKK